MSHTFACDTSYYQDVYDDSYPHPWAIFRVCDGNFRDPKFGANHAWAQRSAKSGKIAGYTVYCVYRPGVDTFGVVKDMVGTPDAHLTVMIDVESWGGQIRGNHSTGITALATQLAAWLGNKRRVLAYANQGDFASLYPHRPDWLRLVVAGYSSVQPHVHNMIGWQYSDGQAKWSHPSGYPISSAPFGHCDHNVFPGLAPSQLASALGVGHDLTGVTPPATTTAQEGVDMLIAQDKKTGRRYLVIPGRRPQYVTKAGAGLYATMFGLTIRTVDHATLVGWDDRMAHSPKGL